MHLPIPFLGLLYAAHVRVLRSFLVLTLYVILSWLTCIRFHIARGQNRTLQADLIARFAVLLLLLLLLLFSSHFHHHRLTAQ